MPAIADALDAAYNRAFACVDPTGKRILLAVDTSGSMSTPFQAGSPLTCRQAAVAMALVALRIEPNCVVLGFDDRVVALPLSRKMRLDDALARTPRNGRGTYTHLPAKWAMEHKIKVDAIVAYTDAQTFDDDTYSLLQAYREQSGIETLGAVVAMQLNDLSIYPSDAHGRSTSPASTRPCRRRLPPR